MRGTITVIAVIALLAQCMGQARNYNVVFGSTNWLNFYNEVATILPSTFAVTKRNATISEPDGSMSVIVDENGIHNANFDLIAGGTALDLGWPEHLASLLILPKPEAPLHYFVFVNTPEDDKQAGYVEVDMSLNLGAGGIVGTGTTWYMTNTTAKLAATPHGNGADYWILQHADGTDEFHAFQFGLGGLNPVPVVSTANPVLTATPMLDHYSSDFWGPMKFSVGGDQMAMGIDISADTSGAALYWFDTVMGQITLRCADLRHTAHYIDTFTGDTIVYQASAVATNGLDFLATDDFLYVSFVDTSSTGSGTFGSVQFDLGWTDGLIHSSSLGSMGFQVGSGQPWGPDTTGQSLMLAADGHLYLRSPHGYGFVGYLDRLINAPHVLENQIQHSEPFNSSDLLETWALPLFCKRYHDSEPTWLSMSEPWNTSPAFRIVPNPIAQQGALVWGNSPQPDHLVWRDALGRVVRSEPALNNGPTTVLARQELNAGLYVVEVLRDGKSLGSAKVMIE